MSEVYNSITEAIAKTESKESKLYAVRLHPTFREALEAHLKELSDKHFDKTGSLLNLRPTQFITESIQRLLIESKPEKFERIIKQLPKATPPAKD